MANDKKVKAEVKKPSVEGVTYWETPDMNAVSGHDMFYVDLTTGSFYDIEPDGGEFSGFLDNGDVKTLQNLVDDAFSYFGATVGPEDRTPMSVPGEGLTYLDMYIPGGWFLTYADYPGTDSDFYGGNLAADQAVMDFMKSLDTRYTSDVIA